MSLGCSPLPLAVSLLALVRALLMLDLRLTVVGLLGCFVGLGYASVLVKIGTVWNKREGGQESAKSRVLGAFGLLWIAYVGQSSETNQLEGPWAVVDVRVEGQWKSGKGKATSSLRTS